MGELKSKAKQSYTRTAWKYIRMCEKKGFYSLQTKLMWSQYRILQYCDFKAFEV